MTIFTCIYSVFFDPPMFFLSDEGPSLVTLDNYSHISAVLKHCCHMTIFTCIHSVFFNPPMFFLSDKGPSLETLDNYAHISAVLKPF